MWVDTNKSLEDFLAGVHQDYYSNFLNVHDEADYIVDEHVMRPLLVHINKISENKVLFDSLCKMPFINFKFDNEYDDHGSFTASRAFNPYEYEASWIRDQVKSDPSLPKVRVLEVKNYPGDPKGLKSSLESLEVGDYVLMFEFPNGLKAVYPRRVSRESAQKSFPAVEVA